MYTFSSNTSSASHPTTVQATKIISSLPTISAAHCLFPNPHQVGAPFLEGKDLTHCMTKCVVLRIDWPPDHRIKIVPLYNVKLNGWYLKTWPTYVGGD